VYVTDAMLMDTTIRHITYSESKKEL